ncbi:MAG: hypothetical protein AAF391_02680 [Bacteroidota bacterium]
MRAYIFLLAIVASVLCYAQKVAYFPGFELINMEPTEGLQYSASKLMKSYIEDNHEFTVLLDEQIGAGYLDREPISIASKKAEEMGARYVIQGEIHFLQGVYIISLGLYEAQTKQQVWHDMAKGAAEQDLDPLLSRLGRSFFTSRTAKTDIEIDEVTEYDQQGIELSQIKVNHFAGIVLSGRHIPNEGVLSGLGLAYTYDASTFLFNFDFEFYPTSSLIHDDQDRKRWQMGTINLGVMYPFTRKRSTFFINGGMEYGYATVKDKVFDEDFNTTETGIGAYLGGGFLINRNSTVNVRMFAAISVPFYEVDGTNLTGVKFGIVTSFARKNR